MPTSNCLSLSAPSLLQLDVSDLSHSEPLTSLGLTKYDPVIRNSRSQYYPRRDAERLTLNNSTSSIDGRCEGCPLPTATSSESLSISQLSVSASAPEVTERSEDIVRNPEQQEANHQPKTIQWATLDELLKTLLLFAGRGQLGGTVFIRLLC